jgi:hypothetical protein
LLEETNMKYRLISADQGGEFVYWECGCGSYHTAEGEFERMETCEFHAREDPLAQEEVL